MHLQSKTFRCPHNALMRLSEESGWTWPKYLHFNSELFNPYVNYNQAKTRLGTAGERKYVLVIETLPPIKDKQRNPAKIQCLFQFSMGIFYFPSVQLLPLYFLFMRQGCCTLGQSAKELYFKHCCYSAVMFSACSHDLKHIISSSPNCVKEWKVTLGQHLSFENKLLFYLSHETHQLYTVFF